MNDHRTRAHNPKFCEKVCEFSNMCCCCLNTKFHFLFWRCIIQKKTCIHQTPNGRIYNKWNKLFIKQWGFNEQQNHNIRHQFYYRCDDFESLKSFAHLDGIWMFVCHPCNHHLNSKPIVNKDERHEIDYIHSKELKHCKKSKKVKNKLSIYFNQKCL